MLAFNKDFPIHPGYGKGFSSVKCAFIVILLL